MLSTPWFRGFVLGLLGLAIALGIALIRPNPKTLTTSPFTMGQAARPLADRWILNADEAIALLKAGASLLDAREPGVYRAIPGAIAVRWQHFSQPDPPHQGKLLDDDTQLTTRLQKIGISRDRPVIVVANPRQGWGEDGRMVWMLRTLGHPNAFIVDGGVLALQPADIPVGKQPSPPGNFTVQRTSAWTLTATDLQTALQAQPPSLIIVDARTTAEFNGATPHREARGGHIPQAIHLHYRDLLDDRGYLLPRMQIQNRLQGLGIQADSAIASYCTGGIRSAWLTVVLADLGFHARNYPGSMWEWSALPQEQYPLQSQDSTKAIL